MINDSVEQVFRVKSIAPAALELRDLKPYQLGIFDETTQRTVTNPAFCKGRPWSLVYKTPSTGSKGAFPDPNNVKVPIKSLIFTEGADKIVAFGKATTVRKPFIAYLGYNGIVPCETLKFECGATYQLVLHVTGKPIRDTFAGRNLTETIAFTTDCCVNCTEVDTANRALMNKIISEIENQSFYAKQFFDVHPISTCYPALTALTTVPFQDYCLTICDNGDEGALGDVQAAYQSSTIIRTDRVGALSTYKVECITALPAAYSQINTVLHNCDTCPAGYTLGLARKKYIVKIDNAAIGVNAAAWLAEVQAVTGLATAVAATLISRVGGISTYEVLFPLAFVTPAPGTIADTEVIFVVLNGTTCTQTTPTSTAWVQCGTSYKITRKLCMTLALGDCANAAADLVAIQAYYLGYPGLVPGSITQTDTTGCIATYELSQYSNCLEDGCDWLGSDSARFDTITPYSDPVGARIGEWLPCPCEGWTFAAITGAPIPPVASTEDCSLGLKFIGKIIEEPQVPVCVDDIWSMIETEGIEIEVSISKYDLERCEPLNVPWLVTQYPTAPDSLGSNWLRREVEARRYSKYDYDSPNQYNGAMSAAIRGEVYGVDPTKVYNHVSIFHNSQRRMGSQQTYMANREVVHLLVEAEKTALFAQVRLLANRIAESGGMCDFV